MPLTNLPRRSPSRAPSPRAAAGSLRWLLGAALVAAAAAPSTASSQGCPEGMRLVPGGRFTLADGSEVASVQATCLDESEVTAGAYAACVARGACPEAGVRCGKSATFGAPGREGHPVNCVAWTDADRFCRAHGKRLPTEAEWEWAARGRLRGLTYPWGEAPPADRACWDGAGNSLGKGGRNQTCPAGAHPASDSPDGFHDLGGNVREWTASRIGKDRVVRGGSWGDSLPEFLAAGFRGMNAPDERFEITGFRCAADPGAPVPAGAGPAVLPPRPPIRDIPPPPVLAASRTPLTPSPAPAPAPKDPAAPRPAFELGEIRILSLPGADRR
ncbi:MAG: SUMF1/EgtB/PvdO family nonheme iron enzyme [Anaeromyxobacter sp.]|nr:SUMF1/EgtB/PvdO family nonheme iron enzyme [Anaeromyxobacter sp.]MBL0277994.1 SUMF1/EgtB/PvdO family nonheme iron enzyme [Anaeromyxobacter sp.]